MQNAINTVQSITLFSSAALGAMMWYTVAIGGLTLVVLCQRADARKRF